MQLRSSNILLQMTNSCALYDLSGLYLFAGKAEQAMKDAYDQMHAVKPALISFHGVVKDTSEHDHHWCPDGATYIQEFVAYIRDNHLGEVIEGPIVENATRHRGHFVQACVWAPDHKALDAWWRSTSSIWSRKSSQLS